MAGYGTTGRFADPLASQSLTLLPPSPSDIVATSPDDTRSPARAARMLHASLIVGQLLFAGVTFLQRRNGGEAPAPLSRQSLIVMGGAAVAACVLALVLRQRIPTRSRETSPDLFWTTAAPKAMMAWVPLEAAGLFALAQFFATADPIAVGVAAVPLSLLAYLNPWVLERA